MSALQAWLLWLIVNGQQPTSLTPFTNPPINATSGKPVPSFDNYKEWVCLWTEHMQWLESDLAAMGLMQEAIEYRQYEHVQYATSSKEMWDCLCQFHVTQWQNTNVHYYFQELYLRKCHDLVTVTVCHMTRVTWGPWESKRIAIVVKYISSRELSKNSIEFSLSNSEQRDNWLNSGHQTLDADTRTRYHIQALSTLDLAQSFILS